ncbi:MAG: ribonuclease domain-containing protein [Eubacteriales bacterium]|nr:ribonuclease domain-containing protein [Eubacteriales bacterium]
MKEKRTLLTISLLLFSLIGLAGCTDNGMTEAEGTTANFALIESTEDNTTQANGTTQEEIVETDWDGCVITTDEIDYDPYQEPLDENEYYTSEVDVATYLIEYRTLPENFITKKEAKSQGWSGGSLEDYGEDLCIGGDYFGNYEGLLPKVKGRKYYECDIDTMGAKKRGAKRIIFSDDGQIYYTDDHYESFTLIYGSDE